MFSKSYRSDLLSKWPIVWKILSTSEQEISFQLLIYPKFNFTIEMLRAKQQLPKVSNSCKHSKNKLK